jgi:hypothetical protein
MSMYGNVIRVNPPREGIPQAKEWHEIGNYGVETYVKESPKRKRIFLENLGQSFRMAFSPASHGWAILGGLIAGGILGGLIGNRICSAKAYGGIAKGFKGLLKQ